MEVPENQADARGEWGKMLVLPTVVPGMINLDSLGRVSAPKGISSLYT